VVGDERGRDVAASGYEGGDDGGAFGEDETTLVAERLVVRCLPCRGAGTLRILDALRETIRPCPVCRGAGVSIILVRGQREVSVADEKDAMKVADLGRCKGAFRAGRPAAFGRVACLECGGRFRPLAGMRLPNHVAQRPPRSGASADSDDAS
jgi:hypothetical protein